MHWLRVARTAALALLLAPAVAPARAWLPPPGHVQIPLWPTVVPDALPHPRPESVGTGEGKRPWTKVGDVSRPTITVYTATRQNTGAAAVVFPGGGYQVLAMDLEGTDICDWLSGRGITCVLLKYRVPNSGPTWTNGGRYYPKVQTALQDAQRALGLVRQHADDWGVDPHRVGVIGFSAGGHLVAAVSTHFTRRTYPSVDAADAQSCRPDFAIAVYPGHLWAHEDADHAKRDPTHLPLRPDITVTADTPPPSCCRLRTTRWMASASHWPTTWPSSGLACRRKCICTPKVGMRSVCAQASCRSRSGRTWRKPGWGRSACWARPARAERSLAQAC